MLDWAKEKGMKLIISDPRCYAPKTANFDEKKYVEAIKAAVESIGKHPAVFGFCVGDEPDAIEKNIFPMLLIIPLHNICYFK